MLNSFSHRRLRKSLPRLSILGLAITLMVSGCTSPAKMAAELYEKGQTAEASNELKQAELFYISCASAGLDAKRAEWQLAAINRLTVLERKLHNPSKAKVYMAQAATLAENTRDPDKDDSGSIMLAQEKRAALTRLADWEFEDGNYISARKLYEKAALLEPVLKIDPNDSTSAAARIKRLDQRANIEHEQISVGMSQKDATNKMRGPEFEQRAKNRHSKGYQLQLDTLEFQRKGGKELAKKILKELAELRTEYGIRESEYRSHLIYTGHVFIGRNEADLIAPIFEEDLLQFSDFSMADLDAAIPFAVDNATNYARDLIFLGLVRQYQGRFPEMLESCQKAEKIAAKVIAKNSEYDYGLALEMSVALEQNNKRVEAIPYRKKALDMFAQHDSSLTSYSEYLAAYATDLAFAKRYEEADANFQKVCALKRKLKQWTNFSYTLNSYAQMLIDQERYAEARKILLESEPYSAKDMPRFQLINCHLLLYKACQKINPQEAITYAKRAQKEMTKYGTFSHDWLMEYCFIDTAAMEIQIGKPKDALKTLDQGLQWQNSHGRQRSSFTAAMLNLKANALGVLGDNYAGDKCRLEAVDICRNLNPPQPGPLASTLFQTAPHLTERKKYTEAEKLYREAIDVIARLNDKNYDHLGLMCKAGLGTALAISGKDRPEAERIKTELLSTYKSHYRHKSEPDVSLCLTISELCFALNDKKNCRQIMDEAQAIYTRDKAHSKEMQGPIENHRKKFQSLFKS